MAVALSNIRANTYSTMYDHLQTGTYAITSNNIHPSYNDKQFKNEGFPQVIILTPQINQIRLTNGRGVTVKECVVKYTIEIYHNSAANTQAIADEIHNKINTGMSVFQAVGLKRFEFLDDDYDMMYAGPTQTIHKITINFKCKFLGEN